MGEAVGDGRAVASGKDSEGWEGQWGIKRQWGMGGAVGDGRGSRRWEGQ